MVLIRIYISVLTVNRPEQYIHRMMRSFRETTPEGTPIHIYCGNADSRQVVGYPNVHAVPFSAIAKIGYRRMSKRQRFGVGAVYRLGMSLGLRDWDVTLALEDDVVFSKGWWERFQDVVVDLPGDNWILSLFRAGVWYQGEAQKAKVKGRGWYETPTLRHWGTQAVAYTRHALRGLPELVWDRTVAEGSASGDHVHEAHLKSVGARSFATDPCLVQHIGDVSAAGCPPEISIKADKFQESVL